MENIRQDQWVKKIDKVIEVTLQQKRKLSKNEISPFNSVKRKKIY